MLTVVVPTRNRADLLAPCLESLLGQTLDRSEFEVLVIDNGSTDATCSVSRTFSARTDNLRYVHEPTPGLHAGRHRGLIEAAGEILVFADDDIEAFPTWLESVCEAFGDPDVAMVGGNNVPLFLQEPPDWLRLLWDRPSPDGGRALPALSLLQIEGGVREISPFKVWGCNFSVRKSVVLAAGGFHPDGMPEELQRFRGDGEVHIARFVESNRLRCLFHPGASVFHKVTKDRMSVDYFWKRGFNQGISDSYTALREGDSLKFQQVTSLLNKGVAWGWRRARDWISLSRRARTALDAQRAGYRRGYAFHQRAYLEDPELRAWVQKPTYLDVAKHD
jgi:glucosyl-dolichyl phosphate glucuronosyltransferase